MLGRKRRRGGQAPPIEQKPFEIYRPPLPVLSEQDVMTDFDVPPTQCLVLRSKHARAVLKALSASPDCGVFDDFRADLGRAVRSQKGALVGVEIWHIPAYIRFWERISSNRDRQQHVNELASYIPEPTGEKL